jgi:hypothetical protein
VCINALLFLARLQSEWVHVHRYCTTLRQSSSNLLIECLPWSILVWLAQ